MLRKIYFVTYPGAALLDFAGPSAVFSAANELCGSETYIIECVSVDGGLIRLNTGTSIQTLSSDKIKLSKNDTVLVIGAPREPLAIAMTDLHIRKMLREAEKACHRYGSICTGAFILGSAGLLDGHPSCTHWTSQNELQAMFPATKVDIDALYISDGQLWLSAGVSTGIDMALAMLEEDHGRVLRSQVARHLLVYAQRSGHQTQFSDILLAQTKTDTRFAALIKWLNERLYQSIQVEDMADFMNMSQRSFHRHFSTTFNQSPARFLLRLRLERARTLIEAGTSIEIVANKVGFQSVAAFRTSFKNYTGMPPSHYSAMSK